MNASGPDPRSGEQIRDDRLQVVLAEYRAALYAGQDFDEAEAATRFPDLMPELAAKLAEMRRVYSAIELPQAIGPYKPQAWIGTGGFGIVYRAVGPGGKVCALKVLRSEHVTDAKQLLRFEREAKTAAYLEHEHIVRVIEVGRAGSRIFIAMELIDGPDLADLVAELQPSPEEAVRLLLPIVRACDYAHSKGVVHRDIKPSNILIDSCTRKPYLTDFGLAKWRDASVMVTTGSHMVGTPGFMAPEQISHEERPQSAPEEHDLGVRADVFSLGATLYFLLTGRPPFPVVRPEELKTAIRPTVAYQAVLKQILEAEPIRPHRLNDAVPPDLEVACLKSLEKELPERYATAGELAAELERFLARQPIQGRLPGPRKRFWRFCRRHPRSTVTVAALIGLSAVAGIVAYNERTRATLTDIELGKTKSEKSTIQHTADEATQRATKTEQVNRTKQYASDLQQVEIEWEKNDVGRVRGLLDKHLPVKEAEDLRGVEWYYWDHRARSFAVTIPTGWNCRAVALSPDGSRVAMTDDVRAGVWDAKSGAMLWQRPIGNRIQFMTNEVRDADQSVAISPDGRYVAATGFTDDGRVRRGTVRVWMLSDGSEVVAASNLAEAAGRAVVFSPESTHVFAGGHGASWAAWDLATRQRWSPPESVSQPLPYANLTQSTMGRSGNDANAAVVWSLQFCDGALVSVCDALPPVFWNWRHGTGEEGTEGEYVEGRGALPIGWSDVRVKVKDGIVELLQREYAAGWRNDRPTHKQLGPQAGVTAVVCRQGLVAVAAGDFAIRVWNATLAPTAPQVGPLKGHNQRVTCLAFSANGKALASGETNGTVIVHSLEAEAAIWPVDATPSTWSADYGAPYANAPLMTTYSEDRGKLLVERGPPRAPAARNEPRPTVAEIPLPRRPASIGFYLGGKIVAISYWVDRSGEVVIWDLEQGREATRIAPVQAGAAHGLSFSRDGEHFAVALESGAGAVYDRQQGTTANVPSPSGNFLARLSPGARYLAMGGNWGCGVYDLVRSDWVVRKSLRAEAAVFDPSETRVYFASPSPNAEWMLLNLPDGTPVPVPAGRRFNNGLAYSGDGKRAFVPSDGTLDIYDAQSWERLTTIPFAGYAGPSLSEGFDILLETWKRERGEQIKPGG